MRFVIPVLMLFTVRCSTGQNKIRQNSPSPPVAAEIPTAATPVIINPNDRTYFVLFILDNDVEASISAKKELVKDSAGIDRFILQNKPPINPNKIVVFGHANMKEFNAVVAVLKKNGYLKFQMINKR